MNLPEKFKLYLITQKSSPVTVKNYVADIKKFLDWLAKKTGILYQVAGASIFGLFTKETILEYQQDLMSAKIPSSTINRYLSALRKFGDFALSQGWLQSNPADEINNVSLEKIKTFTAENDQEKLLAEFQKDLEKEKVSSLTIKNYLVDIRHFLSWLKRN
ncbi:MAG: site-specific integrase [Microgenomates group bacterium]